MKCILMFRTPNAFENATEHFDSDELSEDSEKMRELVKRYVKYNEMCQIEFDTEAMTARVLEVSR